MITIEDIEKAAVDSCVFDNDIFNPELIPYYEKGFKDGTQWLINSIWHDASEVPKKKGYILVWTKQGSFVTWSINVEPTKWNEIVELNNVIKWIYIDDLFPNKEE